MFQRGIECILSRAEKFIKQKKLYKILLENNFDTPQKIIKNTSNLKELFENSNYKPIYPKRAVESIVGFSNWWLNSNLPTEIIDDENNSKSGIVFRNRLANLKSPDKAPGMGAKIASLFIVLCGYEDVVVIDQHICNFLKDNGHFPWRMPDRKDYGGLWLSRYKKLEIIMSGMASECDLSPAIFQLSLWNKYREQNDKHKDHPKLF